MSKKLGQHFLKNANKLKKIVEAIDVKDEDNIIEIGPGHGELTKFLIKEKHKNVKIILIEKDLKLSNLLKSKFKDNVFIETGDVRDLISSVVDKYFKHKKYKIVGNIPYYLTSFLIRIISELDNKPVVSVLTIQKEVAERLVAKNNNMNLLASSVQCWADVFIVGSVNKMYFSPTPNVDSLIIKIVKLKKNKIKDYKKYINFIKIFFSHPRKTLKNNLISGGINNVIVNKIFSKFNINKNIRPHQISIDKIISIFNFISNEIVL